MEKQPKRYTDEELDLIKSTFNDNVSLLKAIRKSLLQLELTEKEEIALKIFESKDLMGIMNKSFLPTIDGDAPINQVVDLMMTVNIIDKMPDDALLHLKARELVIRYIGQELKALEGKEVKDFVMFDDLTKISDDAEETFIKVVARNTIILHIENQLRDLNILANQVELTEEEEEEVKASESNK